MTNHHLFGIRGDVATSETYWQHRAIGGDGALIESFGRYLDRFERRAGQWRIAERVTIVESTPDVERGGTDPADAFAAAVEPEGPHVGRAHVDGVVA
ncbi:MAG: nuclear transport factor 2 family protein [Ilumatobacteraceae bacterium]